MVPAGRHDLRPARTSDRSDLRRLLWRLRPHVLDLVAAFDVRPGHVRAPIALGGEQERQDEAAAYFRAQRASSDAPVSEKALRDREKKARRAPEALEALSRRGSWPAPEARPWRARPARLRASTLNVPVASAPCRLRDVGGLRPARPQAPAARPAIVDCGGRGGPRPGAGDRRCTRALVTNGPDPAMTAERPLHPARPPARTAETSTPSSTPPPPPSRPSRSPSSGSKADEYASIREILGRRPTNAELAMYSVMWSRALLLQVLQEAPAHLRQAHHRDDEARSCWWAWARTPASSTSVTAGR